jgi:hypothetical protein
MELKNLNEALDKYLPPFFLDSHREEIILAIAKDLKLINKNPNNNSVDIISMFNSVFDKKCRAMSNIVARKYKMVFHSFSMEELKIAMVNAKNDEWHVQSGHKYCTLEYFSRIDQIDKWLNSEPIQKKDTFIHPKFNIRE